MFPRFDLAPLSDSKLESLCRPMPGRIYLRPLILIGRMMRLQPGLVLTGLASFVLVAVTGTLGITLLLPLLAAIEGSGAAPGSTPLAAVNDVLSKLGVPLALTPVLLLILVVSLCEIAARAFHHLYIIALGEGLRAQLRKVIFRRAMQASWDLIAGARKGRLMCTIIQESSIQCTSGMPQRCGSGSSSFDSPYRL